MFQYFFKSLPVARGAVLLFFITISSTYCQDSLRLVNLYNSTDGQNWINNANWLTNLSVSEWYGVTVINSYVTAIELPRNRLSGTLSDEIGQFTKLEILNLSDNSLVGNLPDSLNNLMGLKTLDLSHNQFNGNITNTFSSLNRLKILDISDNDISGKIPNNLGKLNELEILNLSDNNFRNKIPINLFRLQNLIELNLKNNALTGFIPRQIGNCKNLQILDLSRNKLTGEIPKEIGKLLKLSQRLALDHNNLFGSIPKEISLLSQLQHIWLNNNNFSGILPFEIGKMKSLRSIFIYHNNFVGPIPKTVANLRELEIFYGQNNSFGSSVPQEFWFLPKLKMLRLENNQLTGIIPGNLGILRSIQSIDLSNNRFNSISDSITFPNSLLSLNISNNNLFCENNIANTDSNSYSFSVEYINKIIGLDNQTCNDSTEISFLIDKDKIDFEYIKTDSTTEQEIRIINNNSEASNLRLHHFDNYNFYISDSLITINPNDTTYISITYSPIDVDVHYDVLILEDVDTKTSQFISIFGEGVESLIQERDSSIPWKFKLHPVIIETESDTINILYDVPETSNIIITIFNLGGRPIKNIVNETVEAGFHSFIWDRLDDSGINLERGEYLCVMQTGMFIQIQQILLLF